jgi:hypothetical protein
MFQINKQKIYHVIHEHFHRAYNYVPNKHKKSFHVIERECETTNSLVAWKGQVKSGKEELHVVSMSLAWFSAHALSIPAGAPAACESLSNAHSGAIVMDQA